MPTLSSGRHIDFVLNVGNVPTHEILAFMDNFEGALKWSGDGTGTDWVIEQTPSRAFSGSFSLHMLTRATSPAAGDYVSAYVDIFPTYFGNLNYHCVFHLVNSTNAGYIASLRWTIDIYTGALRRSFGLQYLPATGVWQYLNETNAWANTNITKSLDPDAWHFVKISYDVWNNLYIWFTIDDTENLVGALSGYSAADTSPTKLRAAMRLETSSANQAQCFVDKVLVYPM